MSSSKRPNTLLREGFALPAVLAVTGVVTLIFLVAITALASLTAEANSARARIRFLQRALSSEATIAYLMATEPMRSNGVLINGPIFNNEEFADEEPEADGELTQLIRTDGRAYLMDQNGPIIIRIQDNSGLVNINNLNSLTLSALLSELNIEQSQHGIIQSRLADYMDSDSLRQPNGAEARDYGTDRVANRPLLTPAELMSVLGLRDQIDIRRWRRLQTSLQTSSPRPLFNLNTAPPQALKIMLGADEGQVERLIQAREFSRLTNTGMVEAIIGGKLFWDEDVFYNSPGNSVGISLHDGQSGWTYKSRLTLSPWRQERPIWIDQTQLLEAPKRAKADTTDAVRLPYAPY